MFLLELLDIELLAAAVGEQCLRLFLHAFLLQPCVQYPKLLLIDYVLGSLEYGFAGVPANYLFRFLIRHPKIGVLARFLQ